MLTRSARASWRRQFDDLRNAISEIWPNVYLLSHPPEVRGEGWEIEMVVNDDRCVSLGNLPRHMNPDEQYEWLTAKVCEELWEVAMCY